MLSRGPSMHRSAGFTLLEVLVTMIILAFGLMGLAALQVRMMNANTEAYQRAQANQLLSDMSERVRASVNNATGTIDPAYLTASGSWWGTGDSLNSTCATCSVACAALPASPTGTQIATYNTCQWSNALRGAAESLSSSSGATSTNVGATTGARGCITQVTAANTTPGLCVAGVYNITLTWQGFTGTAAPSSSNTCAANQYGTDPVTGTELRRSMSTQIVVPLNGCT